MNYFWVQLFLFALTHSGMRGEITNQMEIHCKDSQVFRIPKVKWYFTVQRQNNWKNITSGKIAGLSSRVNMKTMTTPENTTHNSRQIDAIDAILTIANVSHSTDGVIYRCVYKKYTGTVDDLPQFVDKEQQFSVNNLGAQVPLESRQLIIQEGGNIRITVNPSYSGMRPTNETWRTPNGTEQTGLELDDQNLQQPNHIGAYTYTFSYTICDDIVFSEFFYVTVNSSQTTTTTTTTKKKPAAAIPLEPRRASKTGTRRRSVQNEFTTTTRNITIATCSMSKPVIVKTSHPPTPTSPPTSPRTTLKGVPIDLDDPSTFSRTKMVTSGTKTSTWVGIIVGAILGTMILCALIVLIVLVRKGNLRHCCRKQTSDQHDSPNVLVSASQESTIDKGMYCDVPDEFGDPDEDGASYSVLEETATPVKGSDKTAPKVSQKPGTSYSVAARVGYDTGKFGGGKSTSGLNLEETVQKKGDDTDTTYSGLTTDTDDYDRLRLNKTDSSKMTDPETTYSRVDTKPKDGDYDALALGGVRSAPRVTSGGGSRSHVVDTGDASSATREVPPEYDHLAIGGTQASAREPARDDSHAYGSLATSEM